MAGTGMLTDSELLNLIQQTAKTSPKQATDHNEQENHHSCEEKGNVTGRNTVENLLGEKKEKIKAAVTHSETLADSENQGEAMPAPDAGLSSELELQSKSQFSATSVDQHGINTDIKHSQQTVNSGDKNTVSQSSAIFSQTESQSNLALADCNVTSPDNVETQSNENCPTKDLSQTSVASPVKHLSDSEIISPERSLSQIDIMSPSYKIDAELVAMLSREEITNLVHEYRIELESTKKKLQKSKRQLEKANDYNNVLRNMVEKLSSEIHRVKHGKTCNVHVQVDKEDFLEYTTGWSTMPDWHAEDDHSSVPMDISNTEETAAVSDSTVPQQPTGMETLSIADSIKQAAEAVVQQQQADMLHDSGYVYDEHSGLYYHHATGYYYDQQKSLFYDPKTGIYYYYDYNTGEYVFHSQVELPSQTQGSGQPDVKVDIPFKKKYSDEKRSKKSPKTMKSKERYSSEERSNRIEEDMIGEVLSHLEDLKISPHARNARKHALEVAGSYPPCIRVMVVESDCLAVGSLYIVTCTGAKIGRENCDICIPDLNVSKVHAEISYNETSSSYEIFDHASQNGTYLNNQRLSPAKIASEPFVVCHGDNVVMSATKLLCHIHAGSDTCDECEPGVVIATHKAQQPQTELKVLSKEERLRQKKQELNQIKKKYGLKNAAYENNAEVFNNPNYTDKAEERRKQVGSDVPGQKSEAPASVHRPISTGNVGHKLLQKMGWKEGDSLGKNNSGIQEPISVTLRASQKAGLGLVGATSFSADDANSVDMKKAGRRLQAQQRYKQIDSEKSKSEDINTGKKWTQGDTEFA